MVSLVVVGTLVSLSAVGVRVILDGGPVKSLAFTDGAMEGAAAALGNTVMSASSAGAVVDAEDGRLVEGSADGTSSTCGGTTRASRSTKCRKGTP